MVQAKNGVSDAQSGFRAYGKLALERLSLFENKIALVLSF